MNLCGCKTGCFHSANPRLAPQRVCRGVKAQGGEKGKVEKVAIGDVGTTVDFLAEKLNRMIKEGRGGDVLFVDAPNMPGDPATLYAGEDENEPELCELDVNG